MKLVFKEDVKGFIYDGVYGYVRKIFNEELSKKEIELIGEVISEDYVFINDENELNSLFKIESKEDLLKDDGLGDVVKIKE
jgi:hypothetical protein